ncbi:MAG: flagellar motor switch protein FliM [Fimbriimonadales bacterium]|nr:MAG: flagellar motor switch protein FliM [Fimbriimonadales bacterium]
MSEILSQAEIEALLASLSAEDSSAGDFGSPVAAPVGGGTRPQKKTIAYEIYDFRRPDKFSRDQLRTLQMVFETFARLCSTNLATYLRVPIHIELISLEQIPYEDYLRSLKQSAFIVFSAPPLSGEAVLEMEYALVFTMLDRLLGGVGKPIERSAFTEIEKPLVLALGERMLLAYRNAWESILQVDPKIETLETSAQFVQIAPPSDIVITVLMEARIGERRDAMSMCVPHMVIKPITPRLSSQNWVSSAGKRTTPILRRALTQHLYRTTVTCHARLGKTRMRLSELLQLKVGDTILLNTPYNGKIDLLVENRVKYRGKPAVRNRKLVVAVTDIITEE